MNYHGILRLNPLGKAYAFRRRRSEEPVPVIEAGLEPQGSVPRMCSRAENLVPGQGSGAGALEQGMHTARREARFQVKPLIIMLPTGGRQRATEPEGCRASLDRLERPRQFELNDGDRPDTNEPDQGPALTKFPAAPLLLVGINRTFLHHRNQLGSRLRRASWSALPWFRSKQQTRGSRPRLMSYKPPLNQSVHQIAALGGGGGGGIGSPEPMLPCFPWTGNRPP